MEIKILIVILLTHWFADFVLQTNWQAQNKSKNFEALLAHTLNYSLCWSVLWFFGLNYFLVVIFIIVTLIFHTITDYFTSKLNSLLWSRKEVHWFFVSIGFDQVLHYLQLVLTYQILTWVSYG